MLKYIVITGIVTVVGGVVGVAKWLDGVARRFEEEEQQEHYNLYQE